MSEQTSCAELRDLSAEVALGTASGEERGMVLRHAARCRDCRAFLLRTATTVDELLLAAPEHEPPPDFEGRTIERLKKNWKRRRPYVRIAAAAAAAIIAGALGGLAVWQSTSTDRQVGSYYRTLLANTNGDYFAGGLLKNSSGDEVGVVYAYEGEPSWVLIALRDIAASGTYDVYAESTAGITMRIGTATLDGGNSSWGSEIEIPVHDVGEFRLKDSSGNELVASFSR